MKDKIEKFIKENELDFTGEESGLNSNCTIISGFALHLGINSSGELLKCFPEGFLGQQESQELIRVFNYAQGNGYGAYWETEEAKDLYNF